MYRVSNGPNEEGEEQSPTVETNRRRVFRLRFPSSATLKATIGGREYQVIEVAEFSMLLSAVSVKNVSGECEGTIEWSDTQALDFSGRIGPLYDDDRLVIWKVEGITMEDIIAEQRRLLRKYSILNGSQNRKSAG